MAETETQRRINRSRTATARQVATEEDEEESEEESDFEFDIDSDADISSGNSSMGAVGGAAAVAIVAVTMVVFNAISGLVANFNQLNVFGKSLEYNIGVSMDYQMDEDSAIDWHHADTGLVLVVANNKESFTVPLITSDEGTTVVVTPANNSEDNTRYHIDLTFTGTIEGLTENRAYRVSVIGDENGEVKTYCSKDVNTTGPVTEVRGLEGHCTCDRDGCYHFRLAYTDEGNYYTGFSYQVISPAGEVVAGGTIAEPWQEQSIPGVDEMLGTEYTLVLTISSQKPADLEAIHYSKKLGKDTTIEVHAGTITITQNVSF